MSYSLELLETVLVEINVVEGAMLTNVVVVSARIREKYIKQNDQIDIILLSLRI